MTEYSVQLQQGNRDAKAICTRLSKPSVVMHWLIAFIVIFSIALGYYMTLNDRYDLYSLHKAIGVLLLPLAAFRIAWRIRKGFPTPCTRMEKGKLWVAKGAHSLLLLCTLVMPISGFISSAAGGYGVPLFGISLIDAVPQDMRPINQLLATTAHTTHIFAGYFITGLLILHIAAAGWHHFVIKDRTLQRMLGR
ncbi:RNA methyltransferase [Bacterioplanes sanyensis]|uniref:RNA methyltransferase n=1 Tax=Bacterioplanes sanyensis TaxID=1249553 RepID=A0A222FIJ5_9GAMM|nr:cytochrome b [Bacterioplanes sanyensis]ASP38241.1 RNA methyltransferase [Bacterioplanes sanyensis]